MRLAAPTKGRAVTEEFRQGYHGRADTVYHIDLRCPIGRQLPREWIVMGTGSLPCVRPAGCGLRRARPAGRS